MTSYKICTFVYVCVFARRGWWCVASGGHPECGYGSTYIYIQTEQPKCALTHTHTRTLKTHTHTQQNEQQQLLYSCGDFFQLSQFCVSILSSFRCIYRRSHQPECSHTYTHIHMRRVSSSRCRRRLVASSFVVCCIGKRCHFTVPPFSFWSPVVVSLSSRPRRRLLLNTGKNRERICRWYFIYAIMWYTCKHTHSQTHSRTQLKLICSRQL